MDSTVKNGSMTENEVPGRRGTRSPSDDYFVPTRRQNLTELSIILLVVAGLLGYFFSIAFAGPAGFANPNPVGTYHYGGVPRAIPPWLGIADFAQLFQNMSIPTVILLWAYFLWQSWKDGRMHPGILVMVTITIVAVVMEPLINWGMYLSFDPRVLHLPPTLPWMRRAPNVEPMSCFYGYPYYFLLPALLAKVIYDRLARHATSDAWLLHHPLLSLALLGWLTGMAFDLVVELIVLRAGLYIYSQVWPAISIDVGKAWQFPAMMAVPTIGISMGWCAVLLHRDADGNTIVDRIARRFPGLRRRPTIGAVIVSAMLGCVSYSVYTGAFAAQRALGLATSLAKPWPYEDSKIYDPDRLYERAGNKGPFYGRQQP
ncbi:spirocyclase AveC family protein [Paraburkholderia mimosarum]|uniref:spirocyclase AveC family protein n=1 Tax=Paraburkholderia mimosarum TaxID=312026 RepID=UPI0039C381DC